LIKRAIMGEATYESQPVLELTTRFEWKIDTKEDADKLAQGTTLNSNEFTLNERDIKVGLQLVYQNGIVSLQLVLKKRGRIELKDVRCSFWIVDTNGKRNDLLSESKEISGSQPIFAITSSPSNETLYDTLFYYKASSIGCEIKHVKKEPRAVPMNFRKSLWKAYQDGHSDTCVIQVEGKEFKVPKMILTAQSEVFAHMFSTNSEESKTGIVKIKGVSANVVGALIEFLHLGTVENFDQIADKLFVAADKYEILNLKDQCANSIGASLSKENFFDRVVLIFKHDNDELKKCVLDFLLKSSDGTFMSLLASEKWLQFGASNMQLAKEIVEAVSKDLKITY